MSNNLDPAKKNSIVLTEGPNRAAARSYFRSVGFSKDDLHKPIIGIANTWTEIGPCNFHLRQVAEAVKQGIREAGGTPMEFNTVTIHDGITMGTQGMKASLVSREVIADSIELVARGNSFDGLVCIAGCDKNMPAAIMALARLDIPGLMLYGGSIAPGHLPQPDGSSKEITILQVFEGMGSHAAGKINDEQLEALEAAACPGPGACGGQFTANTMAMSGEFLGISPMMISGVPAMSPEKHEASRQAGRDIMEIARKGLKPSQIITREAIENAITAVCASGGSTNAVLHLIAIAHELKIPLTMEDFDRISEQTPFICDLQPGGKYAAKDYQEAGGSRLLAKRLKERGQLHDGPTVSGKTLFEETELASETPGQPVIYPWDKPLKQTGGLVILRGNLAPEGCVVKVAGHERVHHTGTARVFDNEEDCHKAVEDGQHQSQRCPRHPLRRPTRRPRNARDASRHRRRQRHPRAVRLRRSTHRRPLLRRYPRPHGRPRRPRSLPRRPDSRRPRRRHHHLRHPRTQANPQRPRPRDRRPPQELQSPGTTLPARRLRQIRQHRKLRERRSNHQLGFWRWETQSIKLPTR